MKRFYVSVCVLMCVALGFFGFSEDTYASEPEETVCYSAQESGGVNDGYYRCNPKGQSCTWIDGVKKSGPFSWCMAPQEEQQD
jgi:hypothetical protein